MVVTEGTERGSTGLLDKWKGNLTIDGNLSVGGTTAITGGTTITGSLGGYFRVAEIDVPASTWKSGTNNGEAVTSTFTLPAGAYLTNIFLRVTATDAAKNFYVGYSTDPVDFINVAVLTTAGIVTDTTTFTKPFYNDTARPIKFKASAGVSTGALKIVLVYVV